MEPMDVQSIQGIKFSIAMAVFFAMSFAVQLTFAVVYIILSLLGVNFTLYPLIVLGQVMFGSFTFYFAIYHLRKVFDSLDYLSNEEFE